MDNRGFFEGHVERRSDPRHGAGWWGEITASGQRRECYVHDVSLGGARLLVVGYLAPSQRARIAISPFGEFGCTVRWADSQFLGVAFDESERERAATLVAHARPFVAPLQPMRAAELIGI